MRNSRIWSVTLLASLVSWFGIAQASAPKERYAVGAETARDTRTGLVWQRGYAVSSATWVSALDHCQKLFLDGGGWRLPTLKELQTLVDEDGGSIALDLTAFPSNPAPSASNLEVAFWSSSPFAGDASKAWTLRFKKGEAATASAVSQAWVRCVR